MVTVFVVRTHARELVHCSRSKAAARRAQWAHEALYGEGTTVLRRREGDGPEESHFSDSSD